MSKKGAKKGPLTRVLESHIKHIHNIRDLMLDKPADPSLEKVDWSEVIKMGDEVSKRAIIAGILWNGEARATEALQENIETYFTILNGFLLKCRGSAVGAGPTLDYFIRDATREVAEGSIALFKKGISIYESSSKRSTRFSIPWLALRIVEACSELKKTPTTSCMAIVRAITHVAIYVKDIHQEIRRDFVRKAEATDDIDDDDNISPEEMLVAQLVTDVASNSLEAFKEVIRFISNLRNSNDFVDPLEKIRDHCQEIGLRVRELRYCVYPPQYISNMKMIARRISRYVGRIKREIESIECPKEKLEKFLIAFEALEGSAGRLESMLGGDLVSAMNELAVNPGQGVAAACRQNQ